MCDLNTRASSLHPTLILQSISTQIASLTAERQELADRLAVQATRCQYSEQLAKAREQDVAGGQGWVSKGLGIYCKARRSRLGWPRMRRVAGT